MSDRELLERAAKAAGIVGHFENDGAGAGLFLHDPANPSVWKRWNPLADDGDALRLAVKLGMWVQQSRCGAFAIVFHDETSVSEKLGSDHYAATRRAIVRAAASLANE